MAEQAKPTLASALEADGARLWEWLRSLPAKLTDIGGTNFALARQFYEQGQFADARFRIQTALRFKPELAGAWTLLGACYVAEGQAEKATSALRTALQKNAGDEEARFLLALSDPKAPHELAPHTYPAAFARRQFDGQAEVYDDQMSALGYCAPRVLFESLAVFLSSRTDHRSLDIGCGTGLAGLPLRLISAEVTGVDISQGMLDRTALRYEKSQRMYDTLVNDDMRHFMLQQTEARFDLISAVDSLGYVGGLKAVFEGVSKCLKKDGLFAFTVHSFIGDGYGVVRDHACFGHSETYIRQQAETHGFKPLALEKCQLFKDISGLACVCARG